MEFRIADTFTESLARLTGDEQKAAKTTAFDLQVNPAQPGLQFHKLDRARDRNFWSVRVDRDVRAIVHRSEAGLLLCYVGHHDDAYRWAERRRIETHPTTGAAQLVEIRETVREVVIPRYVDGPAEGSASSPGAGACPLFAHVTDEALLGYGIPAEWLVDVRSVDEDGLFALVPHLPAEAAEALLELATGGTPRAPVQAQAGSDPFAHPDAQRRFRVMADAEELKRALEYPWDRWSVFLHPSQRDLVERRYSGPARVAGSAGTGKTVVALHRAVHLARAQPRSRVLLATFNPTLAAALARKLARLVAGEPAVRDHISVRTLDEIGIEICQELGDTPVRLATEEEIAGLLSAASASAAPHRWSARFLETEWRDVVDAWQLETWESYRDVQRLGRKTRLPEKQRAALWAIFDQVRTRLAERGMLTTAGVLARAADGMASRDARPYDFAVIDEAQDIGVPHLRFLAALAGEHADALFFAGDLGQRIFQTPFSWLSLRVDVRGRSHTLRINYRTSHQIRRQADRLLPGKLADVDGVEEIRRSTISAFDGPEPEVKVVGSTTEEERVVAEWLEFRQSEGVPTEQIAVFIRSDGQIARARSAAAAAGVDAVLLDDKTDARPGAIAIASMHLAKGLEFRAVAVMACDEDVLPLQERIEAVADEADLEDVYNTERHLLYVACTRARDHLLVTGVDPGSEYLEDLRSPAR